MSDFLALGSFQLDQNAELPDSLGSLENKAQLPHQRVVYITDLLRKTSDQAFRNLLLLPVLPLALRLEMLNCYFLQNRSFGAERRSFKIWRQARKAFPFGRFEAGLAADLGAAAGRADRAEEDREEDGEGAFLETGRDPRDVEKDSGRRKTS